jgi:hypothetical protein
MPAIVLSTLMTLGPMLHQAPPAKQPPARLPEGQNQQDPAKTQPPGSNMVQPPGSGEANLNIGGPINVNVEGTWQVLAYERSGTPVTGAMTVTIRGNVMTLMSGNERVKTFRLSFRPRNMILITEIDGTTPEPLVQTRGTGQANPPGGVNPGNPADQNNQLNINPDGRNTEIGVYVLSTQFFGIQVLGQFNGRPPIGTPPNPPIEPKPIPHEPGKAAQPPGNAAGTANNPNLQHIGPRATHAVLILKRAGT